MKIPEGYEMTTKSPSHIKFKDYLKVGWTIQQMIDNGVLVPKPPPPIKIQTSTVYGELPKFNALTRRVRQWAEERGIYEHSDSMTQALYLASECGEVAGALLKDRKEEAEVEIGDVLVVLINLCYLMEVDPLHCLEQAVDKISTRTGKMINGSFVRDDKELEHG